ncbi:unnamed protein product, partial [Rotaria sp. Silwood2]
RIELPSNEDIQNTFTSFKKNQIISCVHYSRDKKVGRCHIYSLPYTMKHYKNITNNFPGGLFKCVREISLSDGRPFEHEFFIRIAQAFPFLKILSLKSAKPQQHKQSKKSMNENNQEYTIVKYSHLTELDLDDVHDDYVEEFLDTAKTYFSKNIFLQVFYAPLERVIHNFKREPTRANCAKLNNLHLYNYNECKMFQYSSYFPLINFKRFS